MERHRGIMNSKRETVIAATIASDEAEQTLSEYAGACRRHIWLIVLVAAGFAVIAAVWSLLQTPVYQAKATVVIENQGPGGLERDRSYNPDNSPEYFQTHFELMKSHYVLQRTARLLKLAERPEYQPRPSAIKRLLKAVVPTSLQALWQPARKSESISAEEAEEGLLNLLAQDIEIVPIKEELLKSTFELGPNLEKKINEL